jgi:general secretion pathway protein H
MTSPRLARAFTLIEILVVVSIIGIVLSIAVISLGVLGDDRELREEARRFSALAQLAQDEAVMQGREFGIEFMSAGFRFVEYDPFLNIWVEVVGDETMRMRQLPDDAEFNLWIEGQRVLLETDPAALEAPEDDDRPDTEATYAPHVMIFSSGDMTPFELHVTRQDLDQVVMLEGNLLGDIKFIDPEDL